LLSYDRLSKKPILFKSFTGLKVQEFDNICDREMAKRYHHDYELKPLSKKRIECELWEQTGLSNWI